MPEIPSSLSDRHTALVQDVMDGHGFPSLTQTQAEAFDDGVLEDENALLVAETGNGKTLVAESITNQTLQDGGTVAYLVPSRQLVGQKHGEISEWLDTDAYTLSKNGGYGYADVVVATFESFFEAILRNAGDARNFDHVVLDDFHEIYSDHRGPNIEKAITASLFFDIPVFSISATLGNPDTIAQWLDANLSIPSEGRDIPIEETPIAKGSGGIAKQVNKIISNNPEKAPFLVFNNTRNYCESRGDSLAKKSDFDQPDRNFEKEIQSRVDTDLTDRHKKLARMMKNGVAYHHAGLEPGVKELIEESIHDGDLQVVFCTPTLAYGFDAPINSVILADLKLYNGHGMDYIGVYQYIQWVGRAGRPGYGYDVGHAFPMYNNEQEATEKYQFDTPTTEKKLEDVETYVEDKEAFRWLVLELVSMGWDTHDDLSGFLKHSLYWTQLEDASDWGRDPEEILQQKLQETVSWLDRTNFIDEQPARGRLEATALGDAAVEFEHSHWADASLSKLLDIVEWLDRKTIDPVKLVKLLAEEFYHCSLGEESSIDKIEQQLIERGVGTDEAAHSAAIICWSWCDGDPVSLIGKEHDIDASYVSTTANNVATMLSAVSELFAALPGRPEPEWYDEFETQLRMGVNADDLALVKSVENLGRVRAENLKTYTNGIVSADEINAGNNVSKEEPLSVKIDALYDEWGRETLTEKLAEKVDMVGKKTAANITDTIESQSMTQNLSVPPLQTSPKCGEEATTGTVDESQKTLGFQSGDNFTDF